MCTLVILFRPGHRWPLLLAGNRDEMRDRPCTAPGRHWHDRPQVVAALDRLAGGSWLGLNDAGLVAVILNRSGSLGPEPGKRSRGELVLEALAHADLAGAVEAMTGLPADSYRTFNLVVADSSRVWLLINRGKGVCEWTAIGPGLHMLASGELDDTRHPRIRVYLPRFQAAAPPDPSAANWQAWCKLLASRTYRAADGPEAAMNLAFPSGFASLSSTLIALPASPDVSPRPIWLFADGPPDITPFVSVGF